MLCFSNFLNEYFLLRFSSSPLSSIIGPCGLILFRVSFRQLGKKGTKEFLKIRSLFFFLVFVSNFFTPWRVSLAHFLFIIPMENFRKEKVREPSFDRIFYGIVYVTITWLHILFLMIIVIFSFIQLKTLM